MLALLNDSQLMTDTGFEDCVCQRSETTPGCSLDAAQREPVRIRRQNRDVAVMMSAEA